MTSKKISMDGWYSGLAGMSGTDGGLANYNTWVCNGKDAAKLEAAAWNQQQLANNWVITYPKTALGESYQSSSITMSNLYSSLMGQWTQTATGGANLVNLTDYITNYVVTPETEGQREAREKVEAIEAARLAVAHKRAEKLLFTILTPSQVKSYTDDGCFDTVINGRTYRLYTNSRSKNVALLGPDGKPVVKYCAHPSDAHDTPIPDVLVSQLLMLKANEAQFLKIANRTVLA